MAFMFENLEVYQKALDFTEDITTLTGETSPRSRAIFLAATTSWPINSIAHRSRLPRIWQRVTAGSPRLTARTSS